MGWLTLHVFTTSDPLFILAVLSSSSPVDLLLLPGMSSIIYFINAPPHKLNWIILVVHAGQAFDRTGRRLGRGGG